MCDQTQCPNSYIIIKANTTEAHIPATIDVAGVPEVNPWFADATNKSSKSVGVALPKVISPKDETGAKVTGADVSLEVGVKVTDGAEVTGAEVPGAELIGTEVTGAEDPAGDIVSVDETGAMVTGAVELTGEKGAIVTGALEAGATLTGATVPGADVAEQSI
jgi:hypothetical protein